MDSREYELETVSREVYSNGVSFETTDVEAKLDEGNIQEAESSLREGLALNFEVKFLFMTLNFRFIFFLVIYNYTTCVTGSEGSLGEIGVSERQC